MDRGEIRRALGWALVAALSVAALTAIATAAAGSSARLRPELELLGGVTVVASALTFALLAGGLWTDLLDDEWLWRLFGCTLIVTVAGSPPASC